MDAQHDSQWQWTASLILLLIVVVLSVVIAVHFWTPQVSPAQPDDALALQDQATPTPHISPTVRATTAAPTASPWPSATVTPLPSATPLPTATSSPTITPSPAATLPPSATPFATLEPDELPEDAEIPTAVAPFEKPEAVTNILLLGNDVGARQGGRTDSLIIVSIDEANKTASLLSLPRDLYVVIPGWKITRINQALPHGHGSGYPGGGGALVKDTILYNFGIPVDYYVRIGFDGFQQVVDLLAGVDVPVSCEIEDWRLKEPDLDPQDEENWEMFGLGPGIYHMDGDLALWYVRSRRTSSDFDRGRRQQQVLRAILEKALDLDMVAQLPALWETYRDTVETDLPLPVMVRLAALAPAVRENGIQQLFLPENARQAWMTPGGAAVQLLRWDGARPVLAQLMLPPVLNRAARAPLTVEVVTPYDVQYLLAADNLETYGFMPARVQGSRPGPARTQLTYFGANLKGSYDWLISWIFDLNRSAIELAPVDADAGEYYRVVLGENYDPCRPQLEAPTLGRDP